MSSNNDNDSSPHQELLTSLAKTNTTITSSLHRSIRHHVNNKEYNARTDGLDFLQSKNGIMISYLIDLTMLLKLRLNQQNQQQNGDDDEEKSMQQQQQEECINRLLEMKAALEKMRPLEKRMRYQIDKLLALSTLGAGTFAAVGREEEEIEKANEEEKMENDDQEGNDDDDQDEKALSFKPDLQGMMRMFEEDDDEQQDDESDDNDSDAESDTNQGYTPSKATHNVHLEKPDNSNSSNQTYQPPRLQSVPFQDMNETKIAKEERLRKKQRDRMNRSELAEVVRAQYTDAPEEEDISGGAMLGKQRELSRRVAERDKEIGEFEESHMIRLTMGRKEKKERKRVMRDEMSNLGAIADMGNVVKGMKDGFEDDGRGGRDGESGGGNYKLKGMRKRKVDVVEPEQKKRAGKSPKGAKNSFQKALYGGRGAGAGGGGGSSSKKRR